MDLYKWLLDFNPLDKDVCSSAEQNVTFTVWKAILRAMKVLMKYLLSNSQPGAQGVSSVSHGASSVERTELPSDIFLRLSPNQMVRLVTRTAITAI